jgi:hypothetical protein
MSSTVKHLPPQKRSQLLLLSYVRKVELLEAWAKGGLPPGRETWPDTVEALAAWEDPSENLVAWSSPNFVTKDGANRALLERYKKAREELRKRAAARSSTDSDKDAEIQRLREQVTKLALQNARLIAAVQVISHERAVAQAQADSGHAILEEERRERGVVPMRGAHLRPAGEVDHD